MARKPNGMWPKKWQRAIQRMLGTFQREMPIPFRRLSQAEREAEYPPDRVAALIARAQMNARHRAETEEEERERERQRQRADESQGVDEG